MDAHTAVIHFVGLVTFMFPSTNNNTALLRTSADAAGPATKQVVAIMPNLAEGQSITTGKMAVDPHKAVIAFQPCDLIASDGWKIETMGEFRYIELTHDSGVVTFEADGANGVAAVPNQLPHLGSSPLAPPYQPPYPGASAVFAIPAGALKACRSKAGGVFGRTDTELSLKSSGTITIRAGSKTLTLSGDATAYAANAPWWYFTDHMGSAKHVMNSSSIVKHNTVYCRMAGISDLTACLPPQATEECDECEQNAATARPGDGGNGTAAARRSVDLGSNVIATTIQTTSPSASGCPFCLMSAECSNSQWP